VQLVHQAGGQRSKRDQLLPVQRFHLVGLQALRHVGQNHFARCRAAGHQRPETLLAETHQHGILHRLNNEGSVRFADEQGRLAEPLPARATPVVVRVPSGSSRSARISPSRTTQ